jgi:glutathione peroxidase
MNIFDVSILSADGQAHSMAEYRGRVLLITNTASKCGFTPQYQELEELHKRYGSQGLAILAFPCNQFLGQEAGSNADIQAFCSLNYGVSFPVFAKVDVKGGQAHPLFVLLKEQAPGWFGKEIKWNFTKFLVDAQGRVRHRFAPMTAPSKMVPIIEQLLSERRGGL